MRREAVAQWPKWTRMYAVANRGGVVVGGGSLWKKSTRRPVLLYSQRSGVYVCEDIVGASQLLSMHKIHDEGKSISMYMM